MSTIYALIPKWAVVGLCAFLAVLLARAELGWMMANRKASGLENGLKLARADLAMCRLNNQALTAGISAQNAAVDRMKSEAEARRVAGERALREARQATVKADRRVAEILRARAGQDQCASADRLILDSLR